MLCIENTVYLQYQINLEMAKNIYSVNAVRDEISMNKPTYKRLSEFMNDSKNVLEIEEYEGLKTILNKQHEKMIYRIDKNIEKILSKQKQVS